MTGPAAPSPCRDAASSGSCIRDLAAALALVLLMLAGSACTRPADSGPVRAGVARVADRAMEAGPDAAGARAPHPARDTIRVGAADIETDADAGLPRVSACRATPRPAHPVAYVLAPTPTPAATVGGSPHRPPRAA